MTNHKNISLLSAGLLSIALLTGCASKGVPFVGVDGISSAAVERKTKANPDFDNPKCYAKVSDGMALPAKPPKDAPTFVLIHSAPDGSLHRYVPANNRGERALATLINDQIARNNSKGVVALLANAQISELREVSYAGIRAAGTPLDAKVPWYGRHYYVLLNKNYEFVEDPLQPFEDLNGLGADFVSPYFLPSNNVDRSGQNNVLELDFYAPPKFITKATCRYSYNLNVYSKTQVEGTGRILKTLVIIDPEEENDGNKPRD